MRRRPPAGPAIAVESGIGPTVTGSSGSVYPPLGGTSRYLTSLEKGQNLAPDCVRTTGI